MNTCTQQVHPLLHIERDHPIKQVTKKGIALGIVPVTVPVTLQLSQTTKGQRLAAHGTTGITIALGIPALNTVGTKTVTTRETNTRHSTVADGAFHGE